MAKTSFFSGLLEAYYINNAIEGNGEYLEDDEVVSIQIAMLTTPLWAFASMMMRSEGPGFSEIAEGFLMTLASDDEIGEEDFEWMVICSMQPEKMIDHLSEDFGFNETWVSHFLEWTGVLKSSHHLNSTGLSNLWTRVVLDLSIHEAAEPIMRCVATQHPKLILPILRSIDLEAYKNNGGNYHEYTPDTVGKSINSLIRVLRESQQEEVLKNADFHLMLARLW